MKNTIHNSPTIDNIQDLMTADEDILWQGAPNPSEYNSTLTSEENGLSRMNLSKFIALIFLFCSFQFLDTSLYYYGGVFIFISLITFFIPEIIKRKRKENTKYYITSKRIIFQLWRFGKKSIHQIPFSNLRNIIIAKDISKNGIIYFDVKNPNAINFKTYGFKNNDRRHQPTFEMIENVTDVSQMIRDGISKKTYS